MSSIPTFRGRWIWSVSDKDGRGSNLGKLPNKVMLMGSDKAEGVLRKLSMYNRIPILPYNFRFIS